MRRALAIALGLLLGLALAALADLRLAHLRLVAGDRLPAWTDAADPASSLRQGRVPGQPEVRWRFAGVGAEGLRWQVEAVAPGLRAEATLWLPLRAALAPGAVPLHLAELRGRVELGALGSALAPVADGTRPEGSLLLTGGEGWLDLRRGALMGGRAVGRIEAARFDGESFGAGPFSAELDAEGTWLVRLALEGGVGPMEAVARGTLADRAMHLDLGGLDASGEGLPRSWRGSLDGDGGLTSQALRMVQLIEGPTGE